MTLSLGTMIGLPVTLLFALAAAVVAVFTWRWFRRTDNDIDRPIILGGAIVAAVVAVVLVGGAAIGMWPYDAEYHQWRTTHGTVQAVDSRLVKDGDHGMNQRFVVTFTDGRQRACDDTRCSSVKAGDLLTLKCKRAYQWGATPGYDCNWVALVHMGRAS